MKMYSLLVLLVAGGFCTVLSCDKLEKPVLYTPVPVDTVRYAATDSDFANPERGFYRATEVHVSNYTKLDAAQLKGWRFAYVPSVDCPSKLPVETHAFQIQQQRWSKGLTQCALKLWPMIRRADLPFKVKLEAWLHLTPNISYPLMIIVSALMLPVVTRVIARK